MSTKWKVGLLLSAKVARCQQADDKHSVPCPWVLRRRHGSGECGGDELTTRAVTVRIDFLPTPLVPVVCNLTILQLRENPTHLTFASKQNKYINKEKKSIISSWPSDPGWKRVANTLTLGLLH